MSSDAKLSPVEVFKSESTFLAGTIGDELAGGQDHFNKGNVQLLKHHGTYQQDDRDTRGGANGKSYMFMIRTRIPGGRMTSEQLLAQLQMCEDLANSTLRITSRQALQLHGVLKSDLGEAIRRINASRLTTLAACGDVVRNVMCCPAPYKDAVHEAIESMSQQLATHFAPRTSSYQDIWLTDTSTGEKVDLNGADKEDEVEPIYGALYLPRKFKIAVALPHDNCVDMHTQDLGLLAIIEDETVVGYNIYVGGGQGVTPANKKTFPALSKKLCYATVDEAIDICEAIVKVQRDQGNREDRKQARLKYLIHRIGLNAFREQVEKYYGKPLKEAHPADVYGFNDHMGWDEQGDGRWFYGLNVENGRIKDTDEFQLKSALREVCETLAPGIRLTTHQSILFTDLDPEDKPKLESILRKHNITLSDEISNARRWSMACVAWPTCGLSITESERALPGMLDELEAELARLGLSSEKFTIRMTGCPNGCARPYNCDIGLVGKARDKYTLYIGGRLLGDRLNFIHRDLVPSTEVVPTLAALFSYYKQDRQESESFGDFCHRKGNEELLAWTDELGISE